MMKEGLRIIADIGGTNARFACQSKGQAPRDVIVLKTVDYPDPVAAAEAYLEKIGTSERPMAAALAIASPVTGDKISMTNTPWTFSIEQTRQRLGLELLRVVNDFTAVALSLPQLTDTVLQRVGGGTGIAGKPLAVLGPGTGLGVSGLVQGQDGHWVTLETEGGHATCAAANERENAVLAILRREFGHVSVERCVSGQGLVNLYRALSELEGHTGLDLSPAEVTSNATSGNCPVCAQAVEMFCAMLGTAASNLALTLGAQGGVYIAGGIVPRLGEMFTKSAFRQRFEDKGRFKNYLKAIPTLVITHETPALIGLAALLDEAID